MTTRRDFLKAFALSGIECATRPKLASQAPAGPILFEDIRQTSGINFVLDNAASGHRYQVETMAGGVAIFDYNNDGLADIFFTNGAHLPDLNKQSSRFHNSLFRNDGDGKFTDVTKESGLAGAHYSIGVAAADYDNDGHQDLFVAGVNGFQLFHNEGNGTFTDVTEKAGLRRRHPELAGALSVAAGWFDYDNDGYLDLIVINYLKWSPESDVECMSKGINAYCAPSSYSGLPNLLFHNNGDGTFTDVTEQSGILKHVGKGMGVAFADYDNDGYTDIFVANDSYRNFLFHNNGDGTFTETGLLSGVAYNTNGVSVAGMGVDFRDIDNDGLPDIFETDMFGEGFLLFKNLGGGIFEEVTLQSHISKFARRLTGWGTGLYDFDNDGWKDIFTCNSAILDNSEIIDGTPYKLRNSLFRNNGDGSFIDVSSLAGKDFQQASAHRGAAFGDLNNDGRIDVVTSSLGGLPELFINRTHNGHHWLIIDLEGTLSNRDGLGAKIAITAGGMRQHNHATTSVGYGSSSDRRVHFGLGRESLVQVLEVKWPSGIRQSLYNIEADQILKLKEPASTGSF